MLVKYFKLLSIAVLILLVVKLICDFHFCTVDLLIRLIQQKLQNYKSYFSSKKRINCVSTRFYFNIKFSTL